MTRAPDDCGTSQAAALLGLPLHRVQQIVRQGHVAQPTKGRINLIACALGHVASLREDARNLPSTAARRAAATRDDAGRRAILDLEAEALRDLKRLARVVPAERAAAISAAAGRIKAARVQALAMIREGRNA